ncbi:hypothetical protein [Flagellimonas sp. CMM7]|uniref:hypothetical protein n=1 Tax=Flagellimonas sp. CMM7 TaxID=2654676 RepID=UPI0013D322BA|nr:hypothetical protein [Flagellimonas sp. CMM7]UII80112.1 hypothetical protein LV704_00990 [Flagellimonas sp. CMM7]
MRIKNLFIKLTAIACFIAIQAVGAQELGVRSDQTMIAIPSNGNATSGSLNFTTPCSDFFVKNGKTWVKIDLGQQYGFGSGTAGLLFDINVNIDLTLVTSGGTDPTINFDVNLDNQNPEGLVYLDLEQYLDDTNTATGLSYLTESISSVTATINSASDAIGSIDLQSNLQIGLYYELAYGLDVSTNVVTLISNTASIGNKIVDFDWEATCEAPNYEFQLLRLFNKDETFVADERNIRTNVDWSKALSFQTYSSDTQLSLTIGEGQGFYAWRVRPIGTFYGNGIEDNDNWGTWNTSAFDTATYEFSDPTGAVETLFFEDPDDNTNYQYSRVFTEGNKVSEQATYATTLNQVKQTQRYFPSKDYKIVSQTILDNSGRPTLTTLPIPIEGERIDRYRNNFVTTNSELYRAKHFDEISNYSQPSTIDATGAFGYYSSLNTDRRIPNSEGYPYTRVIFSNDGTDRVVEQSGVGKTHMLGDQASGQGRTVRTLYGTPTEEELVALFGDEAPDPEQVAKVITIDPNNTKSVAYITKEGNTIATGLTFSEDDTVLDKITTGPTVSGITDKITNNTATEKGFKASKRITILEDATDLNISYTISEPKIEGLCNNLEIEADYRLKIEIFDVASGTIVQEFEEPSIANLSNDPNNNEEEITIDFGTVSLNTGSYYIQKTLEPVDDFTAKLVSNTENTRKLIEPYFAWLVNALDEIDCEEEMQYLYNDIFFYGQILHNQNLIGSLDSNNTLNFDCADCSTIGYQFRRKDAADPEATDEFLDFYEQNPGLYSVQIIYFDGNDLVSIDYSQTSSLGDIKPIEVRFTTPCCDFNIPIVFTPPFKKPSPEALTAYLGDNVAVSQLNGSINYFDTSANSINPNDDFLTNTTQNFTYQDDGNGNITIVNRDAYPMDFEGYAISMLYECKSLTNTGYTREMASEEIYNAMRGWHRPGLLNQMVYHMATDNYGASGCANRADGSDPNDPASFIGGTPNPNIGKYNICDIPEAPVRLDGAQYSINELAECWEPLVIELVNQICVNPYTADIDQSSNVAQNVDIQDGNAVDDAVDNIRSWIIRWISRGKIKRKLRKKNASTTDDIADEVEKLDNNLVKTFLDCTGYVFADILDPDTPSNNFTEFENDFDTDIDDGEYDQERLLNSGEGANWQYFTLNPATQSNNYEDPNADPNNETTGILRDLFPNIQDPVYAFKYYAYKDGTFSGLEVETCYRDPNICIDENGNPVPCCGGTLQDPVPCNFCGIGYITCPYDKNSWSCNQRFTFYEMIKNYDEVVDSDAGVVINCDNYYEATEYVVNPDFDRLLDEDGGNTGDFVLQYLNPEIPLDAFVDLPYLSRSLIDTYVSNRTFEQLQSAGGTVELRDINGDTQTTGISIIENDAYAMMEECSSNCDQRRDEFREELIRAFTDRCYEIGECKIDPNDNIIPYEDIELMVDQIVEQCKSQCTISSFTCSDEPCRLPTRSPLEFGGSPEASNDFNTSYIDFGVSGPIVSGLSNRENQTLRIIDTNNATVVDTGETVTAQNISATGSLEKYEYGSDPSIWDVRRSLTYSEFTRWTQAMEWDIVLDIPSKCDEFGNYNASLTYDSNGLPIEPVYLFNEETGLYDIQQSFSIAPSPYVTKDNPTGPGDTFVERDQYIKSNTTPTSTNDPSFNDPVNSPAVGIKVEVDNN